MDHEQNNSKNSVILTIPLTLNQVLPIIFDKNAVN